jgi:2-C-methyl-D-erythritol 2,4-cyclodiphosphate synthase
MRVGIGYDVHKLVEGRDLILGGVKIEHTLGLLGHSDADVLIHAIMDALLGAAALGDIGQHFPDTDPDYAGADSRVLLARVMELINQEGYMVENIDAVVIAQKPKLQPHIMQMRKNIAETLHLELPQVSVKATTEERLGFTGREEGISAQAICSLVSIFDASAVVADSQRNCSACQGCVRQ